MSPHCQPLSARSVVPLRYTDSALAPSKPTISSRLHPFTLRLTPTPSSRLSFPNQLLASEIHSHQKYPQPPSNHPSNHPLTLETFQNPAPNSQPVTQNHSPGPHACSCSSIGADMELTGMNQQTGCHPMPSLDETRFNPHETLLYSVHHHNTRNNVKKGRIASSHLPCPARWRSGLF